MSSRCVTFPHGRYRQILVLSTLGSEFSGNFRPPVRPDITGILDLRSILPDYYINESFLLSLFGSFLLRSSFALFASLRRHKLAAHACWGFGIWTGKMLPSHSFRWKKAPGFCEGSGPVRASLVQHWVMNSQSLKAWDAFLFAVGLCPTTSPCFVEIAAQRLAILHRHCSSVCLSWPQGLRERDKKQMQDKIQERQQTLHVKGRVKRKKTKKPFAQKANKPKERILGQTICMLSLEKRLVVVIRQLKPCLMPPGA